MITKLFEQDQVGSQLVERAKRFAETAYEGYNLAHIERVAARVASYTNKHYVRAAAYLHDCEAVDLKVLHKEFGPEVAGLVVELTNPSKKFASLKRSERKEIDFKYLSTVSSDAQLIKVIERIDNVNSLVGAPPDFQVLYKSESVRLTQSLHKAPQGLVEELIRGCTLIEKS